MRIRWTPAAAEDLQHIKDYLTEHHPEFARSTVLELYESIRSLKNSPHRGRVGREEDTRELVFTACHTLPYTGSTMTLLKCCISITALSNDAEGQANSLRRWLLPQQTRNSPSRP